MNRNAQVPDGWKVARLGYVAEVVGGSTPSRSRKEFWEGEVPWVVPSELTKLKGTLSDGRQRGDYGCRFAVGRTDAYPFWVRFCSLPEQPSASRRSTPYLLLPIRGSRIS